MTDEIHRPLAFLPAALAEKCGDRPYVVIVRSQEEFQRWLSDPLPGAQWLQAEHLLQDPDAWTFASRGNSRIPVDVLLSEPIAEFSFLYRLVDVFRIRDVRRGVRKLSVATSNAEGILSGPIPPTLARV